ncbi:serine hydrolase domain-containing protein [Maricaulis parjimensis]|uniref:serine hydrolase domain-containing protein n=1 Tax=Maricaulis parjimensis TaxID=144023 RepID=UPI00193941AF|nr:serine hydrolase domain-containing protein [Maricaulis parjimensis]
MHFMRSSALLILLWCLGTLSAAAQIDPSTLAARIESSLGGLAEARDVSGIIVFRTGDGPIQQVALGYADWETGARFTDRTRFPAGGITQTFLHALTERLIETGQLDLDAPVSRYLPELPGAASLTVNDLIHSTGAIAPGDAMHLSWLPAEAAQADQAGLNQAVLARLIEMARGARFETLIASQWLGPLGLDDSLVLNQHRDLPDLARGYEAGPRPLDLRRTPDPVILKGHDGLYTTAPDLLRLGQAVRQRRIDLFRPDGQMEAGWQVGLRESQAVYSVAAHTPGFQTGIISISPGEFVLAYAVNIESYPAASLERVLTDLIFNEAVSLPVRPDTAALTPEHLEAAGVYNSMVLGEIEILQVEGGLDIHLPASGRQDYLTPVATDRFFWRRTGALLVLERDMAGRVHRITGERVTDDNSRPLVLNRTDLPPLPTEAGN